MQADREGDQTHMWRLVTGDETKRLLIAGVYSEINHTILHSNGGPKATYRLLLRGTLKNALLLSLRETFPPTLTYQLQENILRGAIYEVVGMAEYLCRLHSCRPLPILKLISKLFYWQWGILDQTAVKARIRCRIWNNLIPDAKWAYEPALSGITGFQVSVHKLHWLEMQFLN